MYKNKQDGSFDEQSPYFSNAWPSVVWDFLSKRTENGERLLWFDLPDCYRESWVHQAAFESGYFRHVINFVQPSVFQDCTAAVEDVASFQVFWKAQDMDKLNKTFFPVVKCPVGCWTVTEKCHSISFKHDLQYLFPSFTHFHAHSKFHLTAKRLEYEVPDNFFSIQILPSKALIQQDLRILVCERHSNGRHLQYIRPDKSTRGRLFFSRLR